MYQYCNAFANTIAHIKIYGFIWMHAVFFSCKAESCVALFWCLKTLYPGECSCKQTAYVQCYPPNHTVCPQGLTNPLNAFPPTENTCEADLL